MAATKKQIEDSLVQLRRIDAHREAGAEKEIRRIYKALLKDLKQFIGFTYADLAEDGQLTYEILQQKGEYARFLEEVEQRINGISPAVSKEIKQTVEQIYTLSYEGMVGAVEKAASGADLHIELQGLRAATPEAVKNVVQKGLVDEVLKKNWQDSIYEIKRNISVGLSNGDRVETMAKRMSETLDSSYKKAVGITRTETHRAREAGFQDSANGIDEAIKNGNSGMRMVKTWRTMKDSRVRPNQRRKTKKGWKTTKSRSGANHQKMEGKIVLVDEEFDLGGGVKAKAPGQSGDAANDVNCRCFLEYDIMTEEEFVQKGGKLPEKAFTKQEDSGIIKTNSDLEIHPDKINEFLLKPGAKHSREFFDVGYSEGDYERLFDDIVAEFDKRKAVDIRKNTDGTEDFSIFMDLGVKSKKRFRTVWRIDSPNSKPRLITSHREG